MTFLNACTCIAHENDTIIVANMSIEWGMKPTAIKIIISISDETSEWLELYCKTNGIFRKDFVSLPLDYFERTGFDLQYSVLDYFPLEKIIGELCWVHNEQKTFGKIHVKTEL